MLQEKVRWPYLLFGGGIFILGCLAGSIVTIAWWTYVPRD